MSWLSGAKWIGTATGVSDAFMIALNLGLVIYGFWLFLISSLLWSVVGWLQREMSLLVLQGTFTPWVNRNLPPVDYRGRPPPRLTLNQNTEIRKCT